MRMHRWTLAGALAAASLPAQMSGTYTIDPNGPNTVFHSFTEAVNALFVNGVNGPVDVVVVPGTYTESVLAPPINGASSANRVTFRAAAGRGTVLLNGNGGDTFALLGVSFRQNSSLSFESLDFVQAPGFAISGTSFTQDVEVSHCTIGPNHRSTAVGEYRHALIVSENSGNEIGWHIHDCKLTFPSHTNRSAYGIYLSNGGGWEIDHNDMDLNGCDTGLWMINNNRRLDKVYDNLIHGSLAVTSGTYANNVCAIRADISNYENDFVHNTFVVTIPVIGCCIATGGFGSGSSAVQNRIFGNVFVVNGPGTALVADATGPFQADGNVYWCPNGEIGRLGANNSGFTTIATWQAASSRDASSLQADPLLVNPTTPPFDFHPQPNSPVQGAALNTPSYLTTDYDGRLRDLAPDAGAYELNGFAVYGTGCAGTGGAVPAMGSSGTAALGSNNFAVEMTNGLANTLAFLFGGASRTHAGAVPLPFPIGGGCAVQAAPDAVRTGFSSGTGTVTAPFSIPNSPALRGNSIFFQWAVIDAAAGSQYGISLSNGGALQL